MTWTAEEQLKFWEHEVRAGRKAREPYLASRKTMARAYAEECDLVYSGHQIRLHLLFAFVQSMLPRMIEELPEVEIHARRAQWTQVGLDDPTEAVFRSYARLMEKVVRWAWRATGLHHELNLMLMDALIGGMGVLWHEWDEGLNLPVSRYVEAQDFVVDPRCRNRLEDARWIARSQQMTLSEIRRLWPGRVPAGWEPTRGEELPHEKENADLMLGASREWRDQKTMVTVWEVCTHSWDPSDEEVKAAIKAGRPAPRGYRRIMWADGMPGFLMNEGEPLALGDRRFPATVLRFNETLGEFGAISDLANVRPMQQFIDEAMSVEADQARRSAAIKILVQEGLLDADEEEKLKSAKACELIRCRFSGTEPPAKVLNLNARPTRMIELAGQFWDLTQNLIGFQELERGSLPQKATTATALSIAHEGSQTRIRGKLARVRGALVEVALTYAQMFRQMWTEETAHRLAGPVAQDWLGGLQATELMQELNVSISDQDPSGMRRRQELNDAMALGDKLIPLYKELGQLRQMEELVNQIVNKSGLQNVAELEIQLVEQAQETPQGLAVGAGQAPAPLPGQPPTVGGMPGAGGGMPPQALMAQLQGQLQGRAGIPNAHNAALGPMDGPGPRGMEGLIGAGAPGRM